MMCRKCSTWIWNSRDERSCWSWCSV